VNNDIVGYGSLAISKWPDPMADPGLLQKVPKLPKVPINLIPAVGINRQFQGQPAGSPPEERYSKQILDHLIMEATRQPATPVLGLYVHPGNAKAIRFYEKNGFITWNSQRYVNQETGVVYQGMLLFLKQTPT
jgi:hypothetical protein